MKYRTLISGMIVIIVLIIIIVVLTMIFDEKSKFIGAWQYSAGGIITFNNDNTVNIDNIGPLGDLELIGLFDYSIANNQVTFTSGSIGVTLNYSFPSSNALILSNNAGFSITLEKV